MTLRVIHILDCDGCGQEIPPDTVLPVALLDEERRELHFCDHRCLVPYAERRHAERLVAVRVRLVENVEQAKASLADAEANAGSSRRLHGLVQEGFDEQIAALEPAAADVERPEARAAALAEIDELRAQKAEHATQVPDLDPVWVAHADGFRAAVAAVEAALAAHDAENGAD